MSNRQKTRDIFQVLYDQLDDAYWAASSMDNKDRVYDILRAVSEIITDLNRVDLEQKTELLEGLTKKIAKINKRIESLKKDINSIVRSVERATNIAKVIDEAITQTAKFLA